MYYYCICANAVDVDAPEAPCVQWRIIGSTHNATQTREPPRQEEQVLSTTLNWHYRQDYSIVRTPIQRFCCNTYYSKRKKPDNSLQRFEKYLYMLAAFIKPW